MNIKVRVDASVGAAYLTLSEDEIVETLDLGEGIFVDLDENRAVVGIEVLNLESRLPLERLRHEFRVSGSVVSKLERLRPSIGYQISRFKQATEGTSMQTSRQLSMA